MKPKDVIEQLGIEALLEKCNNNLKWVKTHFKRVCGENCNYSYYIQKIKAFLREKYNQPDTEAKQKLFDLIKKEFNDVDN